MRTAVVSVRSLTALLGETNPAEGQGASAFGRDLSVWLKGLKKLDRIAGRILDENLLAAVAGNDIVAKVPS